MNIHKAAIVGAVCVAGAANAGTVTFGDTGLGDLGNWTTDFASVHGGPFAVESLSGTSGSLINFASTLAVSVSASSGSFYLGDASGLGGGYFDGGATNAAPTAGTQVLAFGNNAYTSNSVTLAFNPGVTAFGFNYDDIESGTLIINWGDGTSTTLAGTGFGAGIEGFIGFVASANQTIASITLTQESNVNDAFSFYGFSTINVVPVPMAAWAGLGLLVPMGIKRRMSRRS